VGLATAWLTWNARLVEGVFRGIGQGAWADEARDVGDAAAAAYSKLIDASGRVSSGSQMCQALALWFGLVGDVGVAELAGVQLGARMDEAGGRVSGGIFTMKGIAAVAGRWGGGVWWCWSGVVVFEGGVVVWWCWSELHAAKEKNTLHTCTP